MCCRSTQEDMKTFRQFFQTYREEVVANSVSGGGVAGLTGDPPVFLGKKKTTLTRQMPRPFFKKKKV